MNDLIPSNGADLMVKMLGNIAPPNLPQHEFNKGLLPGYFHNRKLKQLEAASEAESKISANRWSTMQNNMNCIVALATFSMRLQDEIGQFEFRRRKGELELIQMQAGINHTLTQTKILEQEVLQKEAQNRLTEQDIRLKEFQIMEAEFVAKTAKLEYNARAKAMEE